MSISSDRLRQIMDLREVKQVDIVENTGINKGALSSYLSGRYSPKQDAIYKLSKYLGCNPGWLMGLDVPMESALSNSDRSGDSNLSDPEKQLLSIYRSINAEGQEKLLDYANLLNRDGSYIKNNEFNVVEKDS